MLTFINKEMTDFISELRQKAPTKQDTMFDLRFNNAKEIYQTRGYLAETRSMVGFLLDNRLDEISGSF